MDDKYVESAESIFSRAVACTLSTPCIGLSRKVPTGAVDTRGADPSLIAVSKKIMSSRVLGEIKTLQGEVRRYMVSNSTPSVMFRSGVYLLPLTFVERVDAYLRVQRDKLSDLVGQFESEYSSMIARAEMELGPLFNRADYPPAESIPKLFGIEWAFLTVEPAARLGEISASILADERAKASERWREALEESTSVLRESLRDLVAHMAEKLSDSPDGKRQIFRDSLVENLRGFLSTFDARNLGGDAQLAELVGQARSLLSGVTPDGLRTSNLLREDIRAGMSEIKSKLDDAIITAPARRYSRPDSE